MDQTTDINISKYFHCEINIKKSLSKESQNDLPRQLSFRNGSQSVVCRLTAPASSGTCKKCKFQALPTETETPSSGRLEIKQGEVIFTHDKI